MPYSFWTWTLIPSYEKTPQGICSSCTLLSVMNTATSALLTKKNRSHLGLRKMTTSFFVHREATRCKSAPTSFSGSLFFSEFILHKLFFQSGPQSLILFPSAIVSRIFSCRMLNLHNVLCECCDVILTVSACHQRRWCQNPSLYGREIPGTWLAILVVWILHHFKGQNSV